MRSLLLPLVVLVVVGLIACGDEGSPGADSSGEPRSRSTPTPPEPKCRKAPSALVRALESSLTIAGGGGLERVRIVRVANPPEAPLGGFREGVYAVAGQFSGEEMDGTVGVWVASSDTVRTGGGSIIGADSVTREFSEFGAAASSGSRAAEYASEIAGSDAGRQARACAERVMAASAVQDDAAIVRADTVAGAVERLLARNDYGPPREVDCARVSRRRWTCDWDAPVGGEDYFRCGGDARATRRLANRRRWVVNARVLDGDPLCWP